MTRTLLLATVLAAQLCAGTISISAPCDLPTFPSGHMTISNCQSSVISTFPVQFEGFTPLELQPEPDFTTGNQLALYHSGGAMATGIWASRDQMNYIDLSLTADFTMDPGWLASGFGWTCEFSSDGIAAASSCVLTFAGPTGTGLPLQSGTITLLENVWIDQVCDIGCSSSILRPEDNATVGGGIIVISQSPVTAPEPVFWPAVFVSLMAIYTVRRTSRA